MLITTPLWFAFVSHAAAVIHHASFESSPSPSPSADRQQLEKDRQAAMKLNYYKRNFAARNKPVLGRFVDDAFNDPASPEESGRFFEGDIALWPDQAEAINDRASSAGHRRTKRKFIRNKVRRWQIGAPIDYSFDGSHTPKEQEYIELALEHWENLTCLEFVRRDDPPRGNRIVFTGVDGCASNVGRHPLGEPQFISLARECLRLGVIAHEVAHALGFWHEQSRPDRDDFVTVLWDNIEDGSAGQFTKEMPDDVDNGDVAYDYGSVMHYRSKAFSRSDDLYTIETNMGDYQKTIGQRDQLSFNDIKLMNRMYCSHSCPVQLPCERGGYTDPRHCDRCRCPDGFTGRYCDKVMDGYGRSCGGTIDVTATSDTVISSPGYPHYFKKGQECTWLVRAPPSMQVELEFVGLIDMHCKAQHSLCMDYVEVKNATSFNNTGMRYCCRQLPTQTVRSGTNELLVLFRSFYNKGRGFKALVKAVSTTQGAWDPWSAWSQCSASCGGCGKRVRHRSCSAGDGLCSGPSVESESCNTHPCSDCDNAKKVVVPCGLFLLFRCEKAETSYKTCTDECCPGFAERRGKCLPTGR